MLKELVSIFKGDYPLQTAQKQFTRMLELAQEMAIEASTIYWGQGQTAEQRTGLYDKDVQVNRLERKIRKAVIAHLSGPMPRDVPYGLLLMSLVKDVERIGDYAKNLAEVPSFAKEPLPDDEHVRELQEIRGGVERLMREAAQVLDTADRDRARELTVQGRTTNKRCDDLIRAVAGSEYSAALAVRLTLGARYYKRIQGHLLNLLSSVLMPLHKLDYYDEKYLRDER